MLFSPRKSFKVGAVNPVTFITFPLNAPLWISPTCACVSVRVRRRRKNTFFASFKWILKQDIRRIQSSDGRRSIFTFIEVNYDKQCEPFSPSSPQNLRLNIHSSLFFSCSPFPTHPFSLLLCTDNSIQIVLSFNDRRRSVWNLKLFIRYLLHPMFHLITEGKTKNVELSSVFLYIRPSLILLSDCINFYLFLSLSSLIVCAVFLRILFSISLAIQQTKKSNDEWE